MKSTAKQKELTLPPDGVYRLLVQVENPLGDKRLRYGNWSEQVIISPGLFIVGTRVEKMGGITVRPRSIRRDRSRVYEHELNGEDCNMRARSAVGAILPLLVPEPRSFDSLTFEWGSFEKHEVLEALVSLGEVSLDTLEEVHRVLNDDWKDAA